ncbi:MAG TPA: AI-2E family transporter [Thermoanaerobaculia bacterium]
MSTNPLTPVEPAVTPVVELPAPRSGPSWEEVAAWGLIAAAILFILLQHLVSALVAGLALYLTLKRVMRAMSRTGGAARTLSLLSVIIVSAAVAAGAIALTMTVWRHSAGRLPDMMNQMAHILVTTRAWLGDYGQEFIPEVLTDADNFKIALADWLKSHAQNVRAAGGWISIGLVHTVMGALLAILVFFRQVTHHDEHQRGPLARQLFEKVTRFAEAFSRIAVAQTKISAVNTTLTGIYLLAILPAFHVRMPFRTTLIFITFVCGLIPVVGNLISNTVITVLSLGVSVPTAVASLVFLILVHKLEYLINSRIVGSQTDSQAWEILMAIIIGEAAFGAGGIVMAPIVYAFVKGELRERGLI